MFQLIHASKHALVVSQYIKLILTAKPGCQTYFLLTFPLAASIIVLGVYFVNINHGQVYSRIQPGPIHVQ